MYVNIDGQLKSSKRIEPSSDSATILIHTETETGMEEVFKCPSDSPNPHHLRNFFSSGIFIPNDIVCGNRDFLI